MRLKSITSPYGVTVLFLQYYRLDLMEFFINFAVKNEVYIFEKKLFLQHQFGSLFVGGLIGVSGTFWITTDCSERPLEYVN